LSPANSALSPESIVTEADIPKSRITRVIAGAFECRVGWRIIP